MKNILKNYWFVPVIIVVAIMINLFFFRFSVVIGSSMEPTLSSGDIALVDLNKDIERNDIVVFKLDKDYLVKRVVGLPGENVQINESVIYINGEPIKDAVNVSMDDYGLAADVIHLKEDEYLVLGDNRNNSRDSREFGAISKEDILGTVVGLR